MNAELLAMLGGQMPGPSSSSRRNEDRGKTILTFKAGKMKTELQPNGKYTVTPDNRRGQISVLWQASPGAGSGAGGSGAPSGGGVLKFEWKDRRTRTVVDSLTVFPEDDCTYSKVPTGRDGDRVYLIQYGRTSDRRFFFWMQDKDKEGGIEKDEEKDEENCVKVNTFFADPAEAARSAIEGDGENGGGGAGGGSGSGGGDSGVDTSALGSGALDNAALMQIMQGLGGGSAGGGDMPGGRPGIMSSGGGAPSSQQQVDALSNILENLGTSSAAPSESRGDDTSASVLASTPAPLIAARSGTLTLADLQGAMAGLATTSPTSTAAAAMPPGPPLSELANPDAVAESGIFDDPTVRNRLIELLPEGQRTEEQLLENLRSPQVAQCLKSLTSALVGNDGGSGEFNSILANFQLKPEDGAVAMASGNPVQAFLDCVLKSVEREKAENVVVADENHASKQEGSGGDDKMEEGG